jgi:hypothetical protein
VKAKLISEALDFERGVDPKDSMKIGLVGKRAMDKMIPGVLYYSNMPRWDYYWWYKDPKDNKIYRAFILKRDGGYKVSEWGFNWYENEESFPLDLVPTKKRFNNFYKKINTVDRVNESLNFERGIDPKTSIGVGRLWNMTKEAVAKEIINTCETELEDLIQTVHAKARMEGFKNSFDYIEKAYNERGDINTLPSVENAIEEVTKGIEEILERYPIKDKERVKNDITNFFVAGEPPFWTLIASIAPWLDDRLKESINFERGIEPRKSMGVGMAKALPNIIENLLRYDQKEEQNILKEIRFYKDAVDFACSVYDNRFTDKERADYVRSLIVKFGLDAFIVLKPVKLYRPMGMADYIFTLTEQGEKINPKKRFYLHMKDDEFTIEDNKISSFAGDYLNAKVLQEAYNFERGLDPQKSLGIGQKAMKKKLIEILPDLSKNILWDEMYKNIITGINLQDTIVTINDEYIIVKTPRLTWRFADNLRLMLNMSKKIPTHDVQLENKPSREYIHLRDSDWMKNYKTPRVYKYRIL